MFGCRLRDNTVGRTPYLCRWIWVVCVALLLMSCKQVGNSPSYCLTGAFLADRPLQQDIRDFEYHYGKKPFLVMCFVDWENYLDEAVIQQVYANGSRLCVTWEPWKAVDKEAIDYDAFLNGQWDTYIASFAEQVKNIQKPVFLRFAHEMNGDWYPWAGTKIGSEVYVAIYRYVKDMFDRLEVRNVEWVFAVNAEDVPREANNFALYYPGDTYVDYVGIDGYNWGNTQKWSRWQSFKDIFEARYHEICDVIAKPIFIAEFSSTSSGGDKARWIREAMKEIKKMKHVRAFVLFNVDKETDWRFPSQSRSGRALKRILTDPYFRSYE